ncbi:MAG: tetratricopeptide repeat protein [Planctomycetota bacterium]
MAKDPKFIAGTCFEHGNKAMSKENWDYAISMFRQAAKLVPDNVVFRQSLRFSERKKYGDNGTGAKRAGVKLAGVKTKLANAKRSKKWDQVDLAAEEGLEINPWDAGLNAEIGNAAYERGFPEVAKFGYEKAIESDPDNTKYLETLGEILVERGDYKQAQACYARIAKLEPQNIDAQRMATKLTAEEMVEKNFAGAETTREVAKNAYEDADRRDEDDGPGPADGPGQSLEADLLRALRKEPENSELMTKLAGIYVREDRLEEAAKYLKKAAEISKDDDVREQFEDVQLKRYKANVDAKMEASRKDPENAALKKEARDMRIDFMKRQASVLKKRVERYPQNSRLKFDLGKLYVQFRQWDAAIKLLQQAAADNRLEAEARILGGNCFVETGKPQLAKRNFERAAEIVDEHDQKAMYLEVHYRLGCLFEETEKQKAETHFGNVLAVDYEYKDTLARLEAL